MTSTITFIVRCIAHWKEFKRHWSWILLNFKISHLKARILWFKYCIFWILVRRHGMVGRVAVIQLGGIRNFYFYSGTGCVSFIFCPLSVFCPVLSPTVALTLCWPHIQEGPPLCICLVFLCTVCCSPYSCLFHGHLHCKSLGVQVLHWGRVNNRERRR